jgi:hypothetical protein
MGLEKQLFLYDIESELVEVYLLPTELGYKETKQYKKKIPFLVWRVV